MFFLYFDVLIFVVLTFSLKIDFCILPCRQKHFLFRDCSERRRRQVVGAVAAEVVAGRVVEDQLAGEEALVVENMYM